MSHLRSRTPMAEGAERDGYLSDLGSRLSVRPHRRWGLTPGLRSGLRMSFRLVLLAALLWAAMGPVNDLPLSAGAAGLAAGGAGFGGIGRAEAQVAEPPYAVAGDAIGSYYTARGGSRTFGPPL